MKIIGCDLHARQQTLAMLDSTTGEVVKLTLKAGGPVKFLILDAGVPYPRFLRVGLFSFPSIRPPFSLCAIPPRY